MSEFINYSFSHDQNLNQLNFDNEIGHDKSTGDNNNNSSLNLNISNNSFLDDFFKNYGQEIMDIHNINDKLP